MMREGDAVNIYGTEYQIKITDALKCDNQNPDAGITDALNCDYQNPDDGITDALNCDNENPDDGVSGMSLP
jgi:hypothetical protein